MTKEQALKILNDHLAGIKQPSDLLLKAVKVAGSMSAPKEKP